MLFQQIINIKDYYDIIHYFVNSLKSSVYTYSILEQPHFKCSMATLAGGYHIDSVGID